MRLLLIALAFAIAASARGADELDLKALFREGTPKSPFATVFYGYASAMIEHGRDSKGSKPPGFFLGALDRKTYAPLENPPPLPGAPGAPIDENLFRLLFFLKELSSDAKYSKAAEEALRAFLESAPPPEPSGPPEPSRPSGPWLLWDRCFAAAPEASRRLARAYSIGRAARSTSAGGGEPSPRQDGFAIRAGAEAYANTGDETFLEPIAAALARWERTSGGSPAGRLSFAVDCAGAARRVPEPLRTRLELQASREDEAFCALPQPLGKGPLGEETPLWTAPGSKAQIALLCVSRYENGAGVRFRDLFVAAAGAYLDSLPDEGVDAWPMTFGHAISLELAAFRATSREAYFLRAHRLAEIAIERFFGGLALPRASLRSDHYQSSTGASTLALALVEVHLTLLHITAVRAPPNSADR